MVLYICLSGDRREPLWGRSPHQSNTAILIFLYLYLWRPKGATSGRQSARNQSI